MFIYVYTHLGKQCEQLMKPLCRLLAVLRLAHPCIGSPMVCGPGTDAGPRAAYQADGGVRQATATDRGLRIWGRWGVALLFAFAAAPMWGGVSAVVCCESCCQCAWHMQRFSLSCTCCVHSRAHTHNAHGLLLWHLCRLTWGRRSGVCSCARQGPDQGCLSCCCTHTHMQRSDLTGCVFAAVRCGSP